MCVPCAPKAEKAVFRVSCLVKTLRPCCVVGDSFHSEPRVDCKTIVSFTFPILNRPGRKKKTEGLQYQQAPNVPRERP